MKEATLRGPLPGDVLREARRSRNLSVQYIARELRLDMNIVDALENDDYRSLPAPIFVKGYIRSYASLLGLDPEPLLSQFEKLTLQEEEPELVTNTIAPPKSHQSAEPNLPLKSLSYMGVTGLVLLAVIVAYNSGTRKSRDALFGDEPQQVASKTKRSVKSIGDYAVATGKGTAVKTGSTAAGARAIAGAGAKVAPREYDTLSIKYKKSSFIEVVDANNQALLSHVGRRGFRDKVRGKAPFRVRISKPESVEVTINGQLFNHLGASRKSSGATTAIVVNPVKP